MPSCFKLRKGNVEDGFAEADVVLEREYSTQHQEHGYIEPEAAVAVQNPADGQMTVYASAQNPFFTRRYVADIIQAPMNEVRIFQQNIGGSFGGKEESIGLVAARAAYLCKVTKRPVKMVFTREELMMESVKRHPYTLKCKIGIKKDGTITALQNDIYVDAGAYNNQAQYVNWKACAHSSGAYSIPNVKTDITGVYTNNIMGGAFRGFGNPQVLFALEQLIEEAAEAIGMEPLDVRRRNCVEDGKTNGVGQVLEHVILKEIIDYSAEKTDYVKKHEAYKHQTGIKRKGIGMVSMMRGCGTGCETPDASGAMITVMEDGSILINSGLAENGQGLKTAYAQIAAEALSVPYESIRFFGTDTHSIPDSGMTVASRGTTMGAQSMRKAGLELREILLENAAEIMGVEKDAVDLKNGIFFLKADPSVTRTMKDICGISIWSGHQMGHYSWYKPPKDLYSDHATGQGKVWPQYAYGVIIAEVEVDTETGYVDVKKLTCSHDLGTVINPALAVGQICGGALQGMGYGTTEDIKYDKKGVMKTINFDKYIIPTAMDIPEFDVNLFECDTDQGTFGAKSIGEPSLDGIAAAIANAVYNATGKRVRHNPCSMEQVLLGKELD
nr:molybdopterin cofactor-binding domain-containing protein [Pseudoflavonifractor sp. MSJ-37]